MARENNLAAKIAADIASETSNPQGAQIQGIYNNNYVIAFYYDITKFDGIDL